MDPFVINPSTANLDFLTIAWILKLLFFVLIFGYVFYAFLLTFRVRILSETVHTPNNALMRTTAVIHLVIAVGGGLFALVLILLA